MSTAVLIVVFLLGAVLSILYSAKIESGVHDIGNFSMYVSMTLLAAIPLWVLLPSARNRYIVLCVALVLIVRTGYKWVQNGRKFRAQ
ncbi:hypothetical protein BKG82_04105 [Mycobacteroides chelonae]|jgi:hypothetical protein|uniref:Uncharacterized protein n=1 Tax=Mycobacteroides chelonae TaxID=1774 RepID=A0A1S1LNF2_MYCCH|nr:hypothetical protein AOT87_05280 [Mycobacteroides sp. H003]KRQ36962.1 hypothetical protein AOT91_02690 [Mycobacteroides sp. H092]KRQ40603.1 hypothetical protein AOT92_13085 [Mycobacteroides sp. H101]KRQ42299.1 hypothetical protein AOT88_26525 [Mycobacteroides sp. H063]KRQ54534.1 hypothetical protein AOT94_23790 [Mycobacteroides sp. HXVII]KRQ64112.1 hypothetical protein AOT90_12755 [Mycobacteroides sp. H079]KRQ78875.1 hypothetical protein AOT95_17875 [Mycobacteroides sp. HXXIII]KRQ84881.1 